MATTVHLVRHAHTAALGVCLAGRGEGWPLTHEGLAVCDRLADGLAHLTFATIVANPMRRAQQTATCIAARFSVPVQTNPAFDEIDCGDWTGRSFAELHDDPAWHAWNRQRGLARVPGGETMFSAQERAMAGLLTLAAAWPDAAVLVVSHADIVKAVLGSLLGAPLDLMHRLHAHGAEVLAVNLPPGA
jgi:probable phosphoglycerate mutase